MILPEDASFLFMRHGQTDPNRRGVRCGGDMDVSLDVEGYRQADAAGHLLAARAASLAWIVAAPLLRVRQSVEAILAHVGPVPVTWDARLKERRLGDWNGLPISATETALRAGAMPPGGEAGNEFRDRVTGWFEDWRPNFACCGLIVASKGIARVLSEILENDCLRAAGNGELLVVRVLDGGRVEIHPLDAPNAGAVECASEGGEPANQIACTIESGSVRTRTA